MAIMVAMVMVVGMVAIINMVVGMVAVVMVGMVAIMAVGIIATIAATGLNLGRVPKMPLKTTNLRVILMQVDPWTALGRVTIITAVGMEAITITMMVATIIAVDLVWRKVLQMPLKITKSLATSMMRIIILIIIRSSLKKLRISLNDLMS
jgi:hypothetical protein